MSAGEAAARPAAAAVPSVLEQASYVGGELASSLVWNMISGFLLYYYTDVALLPVAMAGTLMLVSRVLDAVVDPAVGLIVDRTSSRWGKARPYLLFASVPFGVLAVLCFAVPDWSSTGKVLYAGATFLLAGILYSFVYVPYGALQPMMVRDQALNLRIGSWRAMSTSVASMLAYASVMPMVSLAGAGHQRTGFALAAAVLATLSVGLYLLVFRNCRERYAVARTAGSSSLAGDLRMLGANPVWWIVFVFGLLTFIRLGNMLSIVPYFSGHVFNRPDLIGPMLTAVSAGILAGGGIALLVLKRLGIRRANVWFLSISTALLLLLPRFESSPVFFIALFATANLVSGIVASSLFALCTEAVTIQQRRFKVRNEALVFSSISFGMKVGMAAGAAGTAYALAAAGYEAGSHTQASLSAIGRIFYYTPVALSVLQLACISFFVGDRK